MLANLLEQVRGRLDGGAEVGGQRVEDVGQQALLVQGTRGSKPKGSQESRRREISIKWATDAHGPFRATNKAGKRTFNG